MPRDYHRNEPEDYMASADQPIAFVSAYYADTMQRQKCAGGCGSKGCSLDYRTSIYGNNLRF
jgi:hypothetical protein